MRSGVWVCVRARPEPVRGDPACRPPPFDVAVYPFEVYDAGLNRAARVYRVPRRKPKRSRSSARSACKNNDTGPSSWTTSPRTAQRTAHSRTERRAAALYNDLTVTPHAPRTVVPESPEQLRAVVSGYYLSRPRDPMRDPHTDDRAFVKSCTPELSSSRAHPSLQSVGQSRPSASSTSSSSDALAAPCSSRMRFITVAEGGRLPTRISQCCLRLPPLRVPPQ